MLKSVQRLCFFKPKFHLRLSNRTRSALASVGVLKRNHKALPEGVVLEVLNLHTHDLRKIRRLLVDAFVLNQEPIIHTLCEQTYPNQPVDQKLPKIERHFEQFFSDQFLTQKIEQGMSLVAIDTTRASERYVSCAFVERYYGGLYNTEIRLLNDPFWEFGLRLMGDLHKRASAFLSQYEHCKIAFMSHAATRPEYVNSGLMLSIMDHFLCQLARRGFDMVCGVLATQGTARIVENHYAFQTITEIMYRDYEIRGKKVFAHLAEECVSAKAMVKFF